MRVVTNGELGTPLVCPPHARSSLQVGKRGRETEQIRPGPERVQPSSCREGGRQAAGARMVSAQVAPAGSRREGLRRLRAQRPRAGGGGAPGWLRAQPSLGREASARRGVASGRISQQGAGFCENLPAIGTRGCGLSPIGRTGCGQVLWWAWSRPIWAGGAWPARRAAPLGLRALESGVTAAQSVAGNAV